MMEVHRIALISDIHGNAIALERVLSSIRALGADQIACLGDVATLGVAPCDVLDQLRQLGCACIAGNHDDYMTGAELDQEHAHSPVLRDAILWCKAQLSNAQLEFLRGFQRNLDLPLGATRVVKLFHGSPRSNMVNLLADTPAERFDALLGPERSAVMAGGHTHIQMLRQHRGTWVVNPGSVGAPFREYPSAGAPTLLSHAEYAIIEARAHDLSVSLQRVDVDRRRLVRAARASDNPIASDLVRAYSA